MNLHKIKTLQLNNQLPETYPYLIMELGDRSLNYTRVRPKNFTIIQVIRLLDCLIDGDISYARLFRKSGWGMKKSFINYIHFCVHFRLIKKEKVGQYMIYSLSEKGKIFLDLFKNAST